MSVFSRSRRRISGPTRRPVAATVAAAALAATGGLVYVTTSAPQGFVVTDGDAPAPIDATIEETAFASGEPIVVDDAAIVTQGEEPGPKTVREFTREQPFSMLALTWTSEQDIAAFFRAQRADGTWSQWYDAEPLSEKEGNGTHGTEPIFLEPTTRVQVSTTGVDAVEPPADLTAVFIDGHAEQGAAIELTADSDGLTRVVSRKGWGADENLRCQNPTIDDGVSAITIHHTAGSNNYSKAEAAGIMRGIYKYHASNLGWCDVGYNALVDKYGTIYEGRAGGLNKAVQGAHAGGFNENTWGISMMGDYSTVTPSAATIKSVGELAGWRAYVAGFDPKGFDVHTSEGTSYTKYPYGTSVTLPNIFAHRDVGTTTCPGDAGYAQMDAIRDIAKKKHTALSQGTDTTTPRTRGGDTVTAPTTATTPPSGITPAEGDAGRALGSMDNLSSSEGTTADTGDNLTGEDIKDFLATVGTLVETGRRLEETTRPYRQ
ncbi:N-acetylmuramoyl-L-alanine amidase [Corynebacterium sp. 13CS0277]|uniref:peptidoglycan recognition protein family protein n=1 Tax=Corynebacterium sp. 13CS0277 TaxID=2071994 RepID=UPI000D02E8AC|nr:N-acetylmuramoyl-L-alanine amidase [Corynebacterium sp. 13CS0277]PRQ11877.1 N-acetylmuramoyl-L-alanine amidase [Corynebacterium sp. 13CS0277]